MRIAPRFFKLSLLLRREPTINLLPSSDDDTENPNSSPGLPSMSFPTDQNDVSQ